MKSPPYNPSSNGQAERSVRIVKEVFKTFLFDQEVRQMDTEDQINLFLINYRNSCLPKDGSFPSEKIFAYTPKILLDLINPKKITKPKIIDDSIDDKKQKICDIPSYKYSVSVDPIAKLIFGDTIWYKNHNAKDCSRWVKAKFIKQYSPTIFQISIGNVIAKAHREQLRIPKLCRLGQNLTAPCRRDCKRRRSTSENEFFGFSEEDAEKELKRFRAEGDRNSKAGSPALRRSERLRNRKTKN